MKQGSDLAGIEELVRGELAEKRDFVADSRDIKFSVGATSKEGEPFAHHSPILSVGEDGLIPSDHCLGQISNKVGIPKKYFDRMLEEAPELAEQNVNHWLQQQPKPYMVRGMGSTARAFLSDRYERIDNWDVLCAVMPALAPYMERGDLVFESSHVTDKNLYLRVTVPSTEVDIGNAKLNDILHYGIQVKNSEIGAGAVEVAPFAKRLICLNGCVVSDFGKRKTHLGRAIHDGMDRTILREETIQQGNKAWIMTLQDSVESMFSGTTFEEITEQFLDSKHSVPIDRPKKGVELLTQKMGMFSEHEGESILEHLIRGADYTKYGLSQAVTRTATDVNSVDRSMELEKEGWNVINLSQKDWETVALAA